MKIRLCNVLKIALTDAYTVLMLWEEQINSWGRGQLAVPPSSWSSGEFSLPQPWQNTASQWIFEDYALSFTVLQSVIFFFFDNLD